MSGILGLSEKTNNNNNNKKKHFHSFPSVTKLTNTTDLDRHIKL